MGRAEDQKLGLLNCRDEVSVPWHGLKHGPEALRGSAHPFGFETPWDVGVTRQRQPEARRGLAPLKHFQPLGNSTEASTPRGHRTPRPHGPQASHHTDCGRIGGGGVFLPLLELREHFQWKDREWGGWGAGWEPASQTPSHIELLSLS